MTPTVEWWKSIIILCNWGGVCRSSHFQDRKFHHSTSTTSGKLHKNKLLSDSRPHLNCSQCLSWSDVPCWLVTALGLRRVCKVLVYLMVDNTVYWTDCKYCKFTRSSGSTANWLNPVALGHKRLGGDKRLSIDWTGTARGLNSRSPDSGVVVWMSTTLPSLL